MLKKIVLGFGISASLLFVSLSLVQAKGGGGGGAETDCTATQTCNPSCTQVQWNCGQWSTCTASKNQTRTCSLPACDGTPPAKPVEAQSCTPAAPVMNPKPSTPIVCAAAQESRCSAWGACEEDGKQRRGCAVMECAQERACPGLKCGYLPTLEKRVECRLKLTPQETRAEQKILYSPEYCRVEETPQEKTECINLYWAFERCWAMPAGPQRTTCGREVVGMDTFDAEKKECAKKNKADRRECTEALNEKTEEWLLFQMYELEFLAEELLKQDKASMKDVVALDVFVEKQKAKLEKTKSVSDWNKIFKDTMAYWEKFKKTKVKK